MSERPDALNHQCAFSETMLYSTYIPIDGEGIYDNAFSFRIARTEYALATLGVAGKEAFQEEV